MGPATCPIWRPDCNRNSACDYASTRWLKAWDMSRQDPNKQCGGTSGASFFTRWPRYPILGLLRFDGLVDAMRKLASSGAADGRDVDE